MFAINFLLREYFMKTIGKKRLLLVLMLVGCIVSIDTWAADVNPNTGEWKGEPSVSFTIKEKGKISNFAISVPLAMGECNIKISEIPITKRGEIKFTKTGEIKSFATNTNEYFSITGKFKTPTSIEGKVNINICPDPENKNNVIMLVPWEKEWSAKLK